MQSVWKFISQANLHGSISKGISQNLCNRVFPLPYLSKTFSFNSTPTTGFTSIYRSKFHTNIHCTSLKQKQNLGFTQRRNSQVLGYELPKGVQDELLRRRKTVEEEWESKAAVRLTSARAQAIREEMLALPKNRIWTFRHLAPLDFSEEDFISKTKEKIFTLVDLFNSKRFEDMYKQNLIAPLHISTVEDMSKAVELQGVKPVLREIIGYDINRINWPVRNEEGQFLGIDVNVCYKCVADLLNFAEYRSPEDSQTILGAVIECNWTGELPTFEQLGVFQQSAVDEDWNFRWILTELTLDSTYTGEQEGNNLLDMFRSFWKKDEQ